MTLIGHKDNVDYLKLLIAYQKSNWELYHSSSRRTMVPRNTLILKDLVNKLYISAKLDPVYGASTSGGCNVDEDGYVAIDVKIARYYSGGLTNIIQKVDRALGI